MGVKAPSSLLPAVVVVMLTAGVFADAAPDEELRDRLAELEAKSARDDARIADLEARFATMEPVDRDGWLTQQRADEIRRIVEDVLADADARTNLLAGSSGYDGGVVVGSKNWRLKTNFYMQQRFILNSQDVPSDGTRWGFENARTRFILSGNVGSPEWFYRVEVELSGINVGLPNGESRTGLLDAYGGYDLGDGWRVGVGTFKTPLLREELVDSRRQLAAERSLVNYAFTGGRTDGIFVEYEGKQLHFVGSFNNGMNDAFYNGTVSTGGTSPLVATTADFAVSTRIEWLFEGDWERFDGFTSPQGEDLALMIGGAAHVQSGNDNIDLLILTLDFSAQFDGAHLFGSFIAARADRPGDNVSPMGFVVQGGYYFTEDWEVFARYEWGDTDTLEPSNIQILTVGATNYISGYNVKWTTDIGYGLDPIPLDVPITNWRDDAGGNGNNGQVVIRSQLQLAF